MSLTACGKTAPSPAMLPAGVVVRVGRQSITKAALEHWIAVEAVLSDEPRSKRPPPQGLVPDPPAYDRCVAYLAAIATNEQGSTKPTSTQLRRQCEQKHELLQHETLELLITDSWTSEEATSRGLTVTAGEVEQALDRDFPTEAGLREFLATTGERASDERFVIESQLLLSKLQLSVRAKHGLTAAQVDLSIAKLGNELTKKWTPRTDCRVGYVVPECRQYARKTT